MRIQVELTGTTPLIMHNERLSDTTNQFTKDIAEITAKGKDQTDADRMAVAKLEWYGGIYADESREVIIPTANVIKCFREGGAVTKMGTKVAKAISPFAMSIPLATGGPRNIDKLWGDPVYMDQRQVKVQRGRIRRTRPLFPRWGLTAEFELSEDVLNLSTIKTIIELAGRATGLGDARILGYGRFTAKIKNGAK